MPRGVFERTKESKLKLICKQCGEEFESYKCCKRKYCSQQCYWKSMVGEKTSEATRKKLSESLKGHKSWSKGLTKETDERVTKISEALKSKPSGSKGKKFPKEKYPNYGMRNKKHSRETKVKESKSHKDKKYDEKHRRKISESKKKIWQDPEFQRIMAIARVLKPNKLEQFFDELTPKYIYYVGNFTFFIVTKKQTHNPDFKIKGQRKIIELFGNYWHKGEDPKELIKEYAEAGWECKIFWEKEVYDNTEKILKETLEFIREKKLK